MHLLGDVGQVEVGGEGPDENGGRVDGQPGEQGPDLVSSPVPISLEPRLLALLGQRPYPFHQVEQVLTFLADQGLAEQSHDPSHVRPKGGIRVRSHRREIGRGVVGRSRQQHRRFRVVGHTVDCLPSSDVALLVITRLARHVRTLVASRVWYTARTLPTRQSESPTYTFQMPVSTV